MVRRLLSVSALVALTLAACSGGDAPRSGVDATLAQSWVAEIVSEPARFTAVVDAPSRDGWIAFHRNDWLGASTGGGPAEWRAWQELSGFYTLLADLSGLAWVRLGDTWAGRGTLPPDSALALLVSWAAADVGQTDAARAWSGRAASAEAGATAQLSAAWGQRAPWDPPDGLDHPIATRMALHHRVRAGEVELSTLRSAASQPIHVEAISDKPGMNRAFFDPLVYRSLHEAASVRLSRLPPPTDPLASQLFAASFGIPDKSDAAVLAALGVTVPDAGDATEPCREAVRALDTALDGWRNELGGVATPEGRALLDDLQLVEGLRARLLTRWAVEALGRDQPACALAYAELALDHERSRELSPVNSPTLLAALAAARLRTGNTRLALDALEALSAAFPEVIALDETVGDLAVLQALGRTGDSREN